MIVFIDIKQGVLIARLANTICRTPIVTIVDVPYLSVIRQGFANNYISPMQFCYNTSFTLPRQYQRSRSIL